jgi:hypothetical protein
MARTPGLSRPTILLRCHPFLVRMAGMEEIIAEIGPAYCTAAHSAVFRYETYRLVNFAKNLCR